MAIYSFHAQYLSRAKGHSAVAASAYRHAACFIDEKTGRQHDYTKKEGPIYSEMSIPDNSPEWVNDIKKLDNFNEASERLWNLVEQKEFRKDSELSREFRLALPIELSALQNIELIRDFVQQAFTSKGIISDWSIHFDAGNPHVHIMNTTRSLEADGFGGKVTDWKSKQFLFSWREAWATVANHHLALHGFECRIDHRSYAELGIGLIPTQHMGKALIEKRRRGEDVERYWEQRDIQRENLTRINDNPQILFDVISQESASFSTQKVAQTLSRYVNPHDGDFSVFTEAFLKNQQREYSRTGPVDVDVIRTSTLNNFDAVSGFEKSSATQNASSLSDPENITSGNSTQFNAKNPASTSQEKQKPATFESILKAIEEHESVFSERDVSRAVFSITPDAELFAKTLAAVKLQMTESTHVLALGLGDDGRQRFTTRKMFDLENDIQKITDNLKGKHHSDIAKSTLKQALKQHEQTTEKTLTPEQHAALLHLIKPAALSCMVGRAGTGKSFTIGAVKSVYEAAGFNVRGIALSGIAADGLNRDAGIKSQTIAAFKFTLAEYPQLLNEKSVLIMDEAGMTDSASMHAVLDAAKQAGAKVILLGDPDQLQPVGPGVIFRAILERVGFTEIQTIYRQDEAWQKEATKAFARGDVDTAIDAYSEKGFVHLEKTEVDAMQRLVRDWQDALTAQSIATSVAHETPQVAFERFGKLLAEQLVITYRNNDVQLLNTMLRQSLVAGGHLSEGYIVETEGGARRIAQGERLLFLKSKYRLGVSNGRFGTVTSVDFLESGRVQTFKVLLDGQDKAIVIDPKTYKHFDYGYTATVHKTQGVTKDRAFVYVAGNLWNRSLTYVAMTRHRLNAHLYAASDTFPLLADLKRSLQRNSVKDSVLDFPLAFARRRGIEPNANSLRIHVAQKLHSLKEKVADRYQQWSNPDAYKVSQTRKEKLSARDTLRQDAVIVAQYADARLEVSGLWKSILDNMKANGFGGTHHPDFEKSAKALPEYATLQDAIALRDKLAAQVYPRADYHALAIELNRLDLKSLAKHAEAHERRVLAERYQIASINNRVMVRDKLARTILNDIKGMYPHLKNNGVGTKHLQQYATAHDKRVFLSQLPYPERQVQQKAFADIEQYLETGRILAKAWHASAAKDWYQRGAGKDVPVNDDSHTRDNIMHRAQAIKLEALSRQQAANAHNIVNNSEHYAHALAFYRMGNLSNDTLKQNAAAIKRLASLESAAKRHATLLTVQSYQAAVKSGDNETLGKTARLIVDEARSYHGALLSYNQFDAQKTAADWKLLRRDAECYELEITIAPLTAKERLIFMAVKDYVDAKRAHGQAWREILQGRDGETQLLDSLEKDAKNTFVQRMSRFSKPFTEMRNQLAAEIAKNPAMYRDALEHFEIKPEELNKEAYAHTCKMNVQRYSEMDNRHRDSDNNDNNSNDVTAHRINRLEKAALAEAILKDPKAHHSAIMDLCASRLEVSSNNALLPANTKAFWSAIRQDANILERQRYFKQLTPEEKQCQRLTDRYKAIHQAIGKCYEKISRKDATDIHATQAPNGKKSFTPINPRLNRLFTTRNRLASQLTQKIASLDAWSRDMFVSDNRLKLDKLQAQHDKHLETEIKVGERLERRNNLMRYQEGIQIRQRQQSPQSEDARFTLAKLAHTIQSDRRHYPILLEAYPDAIALKAFQQMLSQDAKAYKPEARIRTQTEHAQYAPSSHIDVERLREDLNAAAEQVALHYLGEPKKRQGTQWRYGDKKGSLVVTLSGTKQGSWYDFQTAEGGDMLKLITHATGKDFKESLKEAVNFLGGESRYLCVEAALTPTQIAARERKHQAQLAREAMEAQKKLQHVKTIVNGTVPIEGTLAERYLKEHRGITHQLNSDNLRFHPALKNWVTGDIKPALVILAHDDNHRLSGVQATFLDPITANKARLEGATKLSRGTISQGSIVHHAVEATESIHGINDNSRHETQPPKTIALAEGLETALSIAQARSDWEVRLTFGVSNFERVATHCSKNSAIVDERSGLPAYNQKTATSANTLSLSSKDAQCSNVDNVVTHDDNQRTHQHNIHPTIPTIIICADNDGPESGTDKAVKKAVDNLNAQGITVFVVEPAKPDGVKKWDFNDALKHHGADAVRIDLKKNNDQRLTSKSTTKIIDFSIEQVNRYEKILAKYHAFKSADTNDQKHTSNDRNDFIEKMTELPNLMQYIQQKHPNTATIIKKAKNSIDQSRYDALKLTPEREQRFNKIIDRYKNLQEAQEKNVFNFSRQREALEHHTAEMTKLPKLMQYIKIKQPLVFKQIQQVSKSIEKSHERDIER